MIIYYVGDFVVFFMFVQAESLSPPPLKTDKNTPTSIYVRHTVDVCLGVKKRTYMSEY